MTTIVATDKNSTKDPIILHTIKVLIKSFITTLMDYSPLLVTLFRSNKKV